MRKLNIILILLLIFIGVNQVNAIESKPRNFDNTIKVYDYMQVLTDKEEENLINLINNYINQYNIDMVLVTAIPQNHNNTKDYAKEFYQTYNFGVGESKDGIIMVVDFKNTNPNIEIVAMGNASKKYDDDKINTIVNNIKAEDNYFNMFSMFIQEVGNYSNIHSRKTTVNKISWLFIIIISAFISSVIMLILIMRTKKEDKNIINHIYLKDGSLKMNASSDKFVTTHTESTRLHDKN